MIQLIQGTDITLYGTTNETISNILIGEPALNGKNYTLGIPKGDTHIWTDRKIGFFDRVFRSLGLPEQGIEANIPLFWSKNVKVELAEITGSITVYEKGTYTKHIFADAYFCDGRGARLTKSGEVTADAVTAEIYSFAHDNSYIPKAGDMIVNGALEFTFDTTTQAKASESMAAFRAAYGNPIVISTVDQRINGLLPDIIITGR